MAQSNLHEGTQPLMFFLLLVFFNSCMDLSLDEENIIKDSLEAFNKEAFQQEPFDKASLFQGFGSFIVHNCDSLLTFSAMEGSRQFQLNDGQYSDFQKTGDCFRFITSNEGFIDQFVPPSIRDSFRVYLHRLNPEFIEHFWLCRNRGTRSIDPIFCNVEFSLSYKHDPSDNPNYDLYHYIHLNKKTQLSDTLISISGFLQRDTFLTDGLKYCIRVNPYSGF